MRERFFVMSTHLECVKLWGNLSIAPGIPTYTVPGCLYAEQNALVFSAPAHNVYLAVPWEQIKGAEAFWQWGSGILTEATDLFSFGVLIPKDWVVLVTWYSAQHDMEIRGTFYVGTTIWGQSPQARAENLAKNIWSIRSQLVNQTRLAAAVVYR